MTIPENFAPKTLYELLQFRASGKSGTATKTAFTFLRDGEKKGESITFLELHQRALGLASHLQDSTNPGDRILLVFPPGLEYIVAFFGCVYAGVVAVPALPPANKRALPRLDLIAKDAQPKVALTLSNITQKIEKLHSDDIVALSSIRWLSLDNLSAKSKEFNSSQKSSSSDLAFLQYTSGSTGSPKAVMVSHSNIIANLCLIQSTFRIKPSEVLVSWLPPHHDMGLIGFILYPVFAGGHAVHFPPSSFLSNPYRWLKLLSDYRAKATAGPNFAYELCVRKITEQQKKTLNLEELKFSLNGAEPIRMDTVKQFVQKFASCGLHPEAIVPAYGLAESTLWVATNNYARPMQIAGSLVISKEALYSGIAQDNPQNSQGTIELPSVGRSQSDDHHVVIVDPTGLTQQPDNTVGEIWVQGPSIAQGYWNKPEESENIFSGKAEGLQGTFLRTGDLGFIREGELYITGRIKEMMIFNGRNIYPHDVEATIEQIDPSFRSSGCAAFSLEKDNRSKLVILQEIERRKQPLIKSLIEKIRAELAEQHEILDLEAVLLVKAGYIPRTTSGKIQRLNCKKIFLANEFTPIWSWKDSESLDITKVESRGDYVAPQTETEIRLAKIWADILEVENISTTDNFLSLGGHSLAATQLVQLIQDEFSVQLPLIKLFELPTLAELAAVIERLVEKKVSGANDATSLSYLIPAREQRFKQFPLTDVQQAYWLGRQNLFTLGGISAHAYQEIRLKKLDLARLDQALNQLIQRHDMLRATFSSDGMQKVHEHTPKYKINLTDLREQAPDIKENELSRVREEMSHQILDIENWPLFEFRVTQVDETYSYLHISIDLLICDAWSGQILIQELSRLYQNPKTNLEPLDLSFRDCVLAEKELKNSPPYLLAQEYWNQRLSTLPLAPDLPLARSPESIKNPVFNRRNFILPKKQWDQLKKSAQNIGVTPSVILLTAFSEVIGFWSKLPDLTINLTLFNRPPLHPEIANLVGDFTSLILLEAHTGQAISFQQKVRNLQSQLWRDLDYAAVNAIEVLRQLSQKRDVKQASMPVVFTSTLGNDDVTTGGSRKKQDTLFSDITYSISQTPQVWLDHQIFEREGTLHLNWDSVDDIFPTGLLDDMFDAYCRFLNCLTNNNNQEWQQTTFDYLSPDVLALQKATNKTQATQSGKLLHELFDSQAYNKPGQIALISSAHRLSYGELRDQSRQLASRLQGLGASPNKLIAVVMEKGWEQVVATLGILYAGAAYLPLDPALPQDRINHIFESAEIGIVLTQSHLKNTISWPDSITLLSVDELETKPTTEPLLNPIQTSVDDLAYVIFTSGSTGQPKGVMISHRGAVNTLEDINQRFDLTSTDRILALSALGFDLSVYDIFGVLGAGAAIVIPSQDARLDPSHWVDCMLKEQVTVWNSVPALFGMLVDHIRNRGGFLPGSLRLAMLSGDWIPLELPKQVQKMSPDIQLISMGGATEASIWSIYYPIEAIHPKWQSIPYGKPLRNQTFHVFNEELQLQPTWVTGQLYIGGIGLAKGYWKDKKKTNAHFIQHPVTGDRLYKTGDLGRYLPDGNIEFLGREDSQVKIQGYRVELGEIESVLLSHPEVSNVVANVVGEVSKEKRLVAYIVAQHSDTNVDALREFSLKKLPHYMVPSSFIIIDAIPLSSNGKVDKKALPTNITAIPSTDREGPYGQGKEKQIAKIVEEGLGIDGISPSENLLYLGATSIDLVQVSNSLFEQMGFRPKLEFFLTNPSISSLTDLYHQQKVQETAKDQEIRQSKNSLYPIVGEEEKRAFLSQQLGHRVFDSISRTLSLAPNSTAEYKKLLPLYKSSRQYDKEPISYNAFSRFLGCLAEGSLDGRAKYLYPSAGAAYPVQTYLYVKASRVQGVEEGAYYYDRKNLSLISTSKNSALSSEAYDSFVNRPIYEGAAFSIFFVAQLSAIEPLYGEKSMHFCHIEAGAMAQLLTASAADNYIGLCGIGIVNEESLPALFDLQADHHLVYSMIGGSRVSEHIKPVMDQESINANASSVEKLVCGEV